MPPQQPFVVEHQYKYEGEISLQKRTLERYTNQYHSNLAQIPLTHGLDDNSLGAQSIVYQICEAIKECVPPDRCGKLGELVMNAFIRGIKEGIAASENPPLKVNEFDKYLDLAVKLAVFLLTAGGLGLACLGFRPIWDAMRGEKRGGNNPEGFDMAVNSLERVSTATRGMCYDLGLRNGHASRMTALSSKPDKKGAASHHWYGWYVGMGHTTQTNRPDITSYG